MKFLNLDKPLSQKILDAMGNEGIFFNRYHGLPDDTTEEQVVRMVGSNERYASYDLYLKWCKTANTSLVNVLK